tara:strand:+ start:1746 stop:1961 length:216 start_codon:yes stop_codon:yes gene_type:complete
MFLLGVVGFIFFGAIGYFAYTFGQCLCVFSRLDKIMNKKIIGVLSVFLYIYFVYMNQDVLIQALMKPFTDI